jgi:hypothetical protein
MKFAIIALLVCMGAPKQTGQEIYVCKNANISLYSKAPIEDIEARSTKGTSVYNATTGDLAFSLPVNSFIFPKSLMQEHFNENYMESDKFPQASFKGKVQEHINAGKEGIYPISVAGILSVHGVNQTRTITGAITVKDGIVNLSSEFVVKCADHHITIPTIVFHNIAESIRIQVSATYDAYKK